MRVEEISALQRIEHILLLDVCAAATMADSSTRMQFRWIDWNRDHIAKHGIDSEETENVVRGARPPFPEQIGDDKLLV